MSEAQKARQRRQAAETDSGDKVCSTRSSKKAGLARTRRPRNAAKTWSRSSSPRCSMAR